MLSRDQARDWWDIFLRSSGVELFQGMLNETETGERVAIDVHVENFNAEPVPDPVALMLLMRAAIKTLALSVAIEQWRAKQGADGQCQETQTSSKIRRNGTSGGNGTSVGVTRLP